MLVLPVGFFVQANIKLNQVDTICHVLSGSAVVTTRIANIRLNVWDISQTEPVLKLVLTVGCVISTRLELLKKGVFVGFGGIQ